MFIKHSTVITNRLRDLTGLAHYKNSQLRNLAVAKVALEQNNLKAALEIILEMQLKNLDVGFSMDDVTKLLNTPIANGQEETIRDIIEESFPNQTKKAVPVTKELFPDADTFDSINAFGLPKDVEPQNCVILDKFQDKSFHLRHEYYLVKRNNGRLVLLLISTVKPYLRKARILRTGNLSKDSFNALKSKNENAK